MKHDLDTAHLEHITPVCDEDKAGLNKAEAQYKGSWKRRGGIGAYMMLCRKWDRIENAIESDSGVTMYGKKVSLRHALAMLTAKLEQCGSSDLGSQNIGQILDVLQGVQGDHRFDIFAKIASDDRPEGLIDDIRDLRRYLVLVEAEMRARGSKGAVSTHRDNVVQTTVLPEAPSDGGAK